MRQVLCRMNHSSCRRCRGCATLQILFLSLSVTVCRLDSVGGSKSRRSKIDSMADFAVGTHSFSCQANECKSLNSQGFHR